MTRQWGFPTSYKHIRKQNEVCIIFEFTKENIKTPMAQLFGLKMKKLIECCSSLTQSNSANNCIQTDRLPAVFSSKLRGRLDVNLFCDMYRYG